MSLRVEQLGSRSKTELIQFHEVDGYLYNSETNEPLMGDTVYFYRNASYDCTNGGVSSKYERMMLVGEGVAKKFKVDASEPFLQLIRHQVSNPMMNIDSKHAIPRNYELDGKWHMYGGNACGGLDSSSNIGQDFLRVHDRVEGK